MQMLDKNSFDELVDASSCKPRLKRELRFITSTEGITAEEWHDSEMLAVSDRTGNKGVLIVSIESGTYVLPYERKQLARSSTTGRAQPIICDICRTWQSGDRAGSISFTGVRNGRANIAYVCCFDLKCSSHVRTKTNAAKVSRAQLREDLNNEKRVMRLNERLEDLMHYLKAEAVG